MNRKSALSSPRQTARRVCDWRICSVYWGHKASTLPSTTYRENRKLAFGEKERKLELFATVCKNSVIREPVVSFEDRQPALTFAIIRGNKKFAFGEHVVFFEDRKSSFSSPQQSVQFSSVQNDVYALGKFPMHCIPFLRSFFEIVPILVRLTTTLSRPFKVDRRDLPLSMSLSSIRNRWCDVPGFVLAVSISSFSIHQIFRHASRLRWLLCPPVIICSVISLDCDMSRTWHSREPLKVGVELFHMPVRASHTSSRSPTIHESGEPAFGGPAVFWGRKISRLHLVWNEIRRIVYHRRAHVEDPTAAERRWPGEKIVRNSTNVEN